MEVIHPRLQDTMFDVRAYLHLGGWVVAQTQKWYPACKMRAIGSGAPSTK
jgi:hypothetical protein